MSAFMVSTETMQRVVDAIDKRHCNSHWQGMPTEDSKCLDQIGAALFDLNYAAVTARYHDPSQSVPQFKYRPLGKVRDDEHFIALECLIYQCSEGNIPETSNMYKALLKLRDKIALNVAHEAAKQNGAPWDWPERA